MTTTKGDSDFNPQAIVEKMAKVMYQWQQIQLHDYMDEDKLFICTLLCSYHPDSEVRKEGTQPLLSLQSNWNVKIHQLLAKDNFLEGVVLDHNVLVPFRIMGKVASNVNQGRGGTASSPEKANSQTLETVSAGYTAKS